MQLFESKFKEYLNEDIGDMLIGLFSGGFVSLLIHMLTKNSESSKDFPVRKPDDTINRTKTSLALNAIIEALAGKKPEKFAKILLNGWFAAWIIKEYYESDNLGDMSVKELNRFVTDKWQQHEGMLIKSAEQKANAIGKDRQEFMQAISNLQSSLKDAKSNLQSTTDSKMNRKKFNTRKQRAFSLFRKELKKMGLDSISFDEYSDGDSAIFSNVGQATGFLKRLAKKGEEFKFTLDGKKVDGTDYTTNVTYNPKDQSVEDILVVTDDSGKMKSFRVSGIESINNIEVL